MTRRLRRIPAERVTLPPAFISELGSLHPWFQVAQQRADRLGLTVVRAYRVATATSTTLRIEFFSAEHHPGDETVVWTLREKVRAPKGKPSLRGRS